VNQWWPADGRQSAPEPHCALPGDYVDDIKGKLAGVGNALMYATIRPEPKERKSRSCSRLSASLPVVRASR